MSDCDASPRLFTLHYCTVVTSDTAAHVGRGAVLYQLTDIPHKEVIALSLCARPLAAARAWTAHNAPLDTSNVYLC